MGTFFTSQKRKSPAARAQAMVEFAIVLPILMMVLIGIFEVGRMVFIYTAVTNASREAARFGSAVGYDDTGVIKYKHCGSSAVDPMAGIRGMARRSAYFMNLADADIDITYDKGPGTASFHTCTGTVDPGYFVTSQDRIVVTVRGQYRPYTLLMPFGARTFTATSARTILGFVGLPENTPVPTSIPTTLVPSDTAVPTLTPEPTDTPTPTATATSAGAGYTPTPADWLTPMDTPTPVNTPTPANTVVPVDPPTEEKP
jgi:hypothetical protein